MALNTDGSRLPKRLTGRKRCLRALKYWVCVAGAMYVPVLLIGKLLAAAMLVAGPIHAHAQEAVETPPRVVLGEADLADQAEITRNLYRRITPGDGALVQDAGTWPAAWEEFGEGWASAVAEREFGTWSIPISVMQEGGTTVVRDAAGRELWRGTTDFARPESAGVALTGALVGEDEWDVHEAVKEAVAVLETGAGGTADARQDSIPRNLANENVDQMLE